jgi:O-antigen/teichoic acid export membrane protein
MGERIKKSIKNAEVNLIFYFLSIFLAFFSRKIFLDCLGAEFIGLTGTLYSILGYLNLAELGISSSISYFLYKPLQQKNKSSISELLSLFGYLYSKIGTIILGGGIFISIFFPWLFEKTNLGLGIVYFSFYSILGSSLIGYFINYRQILLSADQKNYLVAIYFETAGLTKTVLQIFLAYKYQNLYVWVAVEFIFGLIGCIVLNWKINKEYPWLKTEKKQGRILLKKHPGILKKTRQVFIHKMKDFVLSKSDELFIFAFVSLKMVAYYGNYTLIVSRLGHMFTSILDGANAGIGNLVAEGEKQNIMKVFWELTTIRHFVAAFLCFSIYHFIEPLIILWLGEEYVLDKSILIFLVIYLYISTSRGVVDMFNFAHGLFSDVWAAWAELIINVSVTIVAAYYWGITGILLGKITSTLPIIVFWKPYYLFHNGLQMSYRLYWIGAIRNYIVSLVSIILTHYILHFFPILPSEGYTSLITYSSLGIIILLSINIPLIIFFCKGGKDCMIRIQQTIHKNKT